MSNTEKKTQANANVDNTPEIELNCFDAMEANEEAQRLKLETKGAIKAIRIYCKGKVILDYELNNNYEAWKAADRKARDITKRYIKQCKRKKY
jgi:hypothetical protein